MQEQNFEKQVQFKLDELSLTPSAPVWQKVEKKIRQKKKRRRVLAFWLFALFLAGGGAFWGLYSTFYDDHRASTTTSVNQTSGSSLNSTIEKETLSTTTKETKPATIIQAPATVNTPVSNSSSITINTTENAPSQPFLGARSVAKKQTKGTHTSLAKVKKERNAVLYQKGTITKVKPQREKNNIAVQPDAEPLTTTIAINEPQLEKGNSRTATSIDVQLTDTATTQHTQQPAVTMTEETKPSIDSAQTQKAKPKAPKWSWAVQAAYGVSSLKEDFLSKTAGMPEAYSDPSNSGSPTSPALPSVSSKIDKGPALHLAATIKRNLNNRFAITASLQYSFFSTKSKVGQAVVRDTIVRNVRTENLDLSQYYRASQNGPLKEYTNHYHFVELPVGIEWQLHKRLPLRLQTGVSLSYLVATNALVFDRNAGIYYRNDDQFTKAQVHFYNGLTYRVWKHKKYGIHLGPYIQFGMTNLQKESSRHHLLSTGIKTQFSF